VNTLFVVAGFASVAAVAAGVVAMCGLALLWFDRRSIAK